jgi:hypothetical protein
MSDGRVVHPVCQRLYGVQAVYSRNINNMAQALLDAALFGDVDAIIEGAKQIVEDSKCRIVIKEWARSLREAHRAFLEEQGVMLAEPPQEEEDGHGALQPGEAPAFGDTGRGDRR